MVTRSSMGAVTKAVLLVLAVLVRVRGGVFDEPNTLPDRQTMVHLFEWKWTDVARECEDFLQHYGYGAVQISPPNEHITLEINGNRPWWIRYQPVSYRLVSRSGTEAQFKDMVQRCNKVGVRIIVDTVINHMVGAGQDYGVNGVGDTDGSRFKGDSYSEYFPDVPYDDSGLFHDSLCASCGPDCNIPQSAYSSNAWQVRNCRLSGLLDLDQSNAAVQAAIAKYMNTLIGIGVAGFRVDATKHMWPQDLDAIYNGKLNNLRSDIFGPNVKPFIVGEVIDKGGEAVKGSDYTANLGRITNFRFGQDVKAAVTNANNWKYFGNFGPSWEAGWAGHDVLSFIDNHDNQRGGDVLTHKSGTEYVMATAYMLAWDYGYPRVMSSYYFSYSDQGPPSTGSPNYFTTSPSFGADLSCAKASGWVCEHRWEAVRNMALFRSVTTGAPVAGIVTRDKAIAFQRLGKGFFAVNSGGTWSGRFQTGLPPGLYCNVVAGSVSGASCSGQGPVTVASDGSAQLSLAYGAFAIHVGARPGGHASSAAPPSPKPTLPVPAGYKKTVILLKIATRPGQDVFVRGGIGNEYASQNGKACANSVAPGDPCSLPMRTVTKVPSDFVTYTDWEAGDDYLDWYGAEAGQGSYQGQAAQGTPLAYSTDSPSAHAYQPYNSFGAGYWMTVVELDCSHTVNGWFELKGYETNGQGWEGDIKQGKCGGNFPSASGHYSGGQNHYALCGALNVFHFNSNACTINKLPF